MGTAIFGLAAVFAMGGLAAKASLLGLAAAVSPFVLLAVAAAAVLLIIIDRLTSNNANFNDPAIRLIEAISMIAMLGVVAAAVGLPLLYAALYITLLLIIARQAYLAYCTFNDGKC